MPETKKTWKQIGIVNKTVDIKLVTFRNVSCFCISS